MKPSPFFPKARAHLVAILIVVFGAASRLPMLLGDELDDSKKTVSELQAIIALQAAEIAALKAQIIGAIATEAEVEKVLRSSIDSESDHRLRLTFFRKVDGTKDSGNYYADVEAEFEAVRPCIWGPEVIGSWEGCFATSPPNTRQLPMLEGFSGKLVLKSGDRIQFKGTMILQKAESGWRGSFVEAKLLGYNKPDAITRTDSKPPEAAPKSAGSGVERPKLEKIAYVEVRIENHLKKPIVVSLDGGTEVEIKSQQVSTSKHTANSKHQLKLTGFFEVIEKEIQLHDDDMVIPIN